METKRYESGNRILVSGSTVTCLPLALVVYLLVCTRLLLHFQTQKHLYCITVVINHLPRKIITNGRQDLDYVATAHFFFFSKHAFLSFLLYSSVFLLTVSDKYMIKFREKECLFASCNFQANNGHYRVKGLSSNDILNWTGFFHLLLC